MYKMYWRSERVRKGSQIDSEKRLGGWCIEGEVSQQIIALKIVVNKKYFVHYFCVLFTE